MRKPFKKASHDEYSELSNEEYTDAVAAYNTVMSMSDERKKLFIHNILSSENGKNMSKTVAGLFELGYVGHVFEAETPVGKLKLRLTVEEVE